VCTLSVRARKAGTIGLVPVGLPDGW
jgi:hypothetical protein